MIDLKTGDVVYVSLEPTRGDEKKKTRPCLVVQEKITPLNLITVLPITEDSLARKEPFFVKIPKGMQTGLSKASAVDCYQVRTLSLERCLKKIGSLSEEIMDKVKSCLAMTLGICSYHVEDSSTFLH